jgi:hypothetical protein
VLLFCVHLIPYTEKHKKTRLEVLLENKTFPLVFLLSYNKGPPIDDKDMTQL